MNLYNYKSSLDKDGIMFSFSGPMSHEIIEGIGNAIRQKIGEGGNKQLALKVFSIFVEQVENVINYSAEKEKSDNDRRFGIVVIGEQDGQFYISGGNKIEKANELKLKDYLTRLASMDKQELKAFYKEKRRTESDSDSKGAGIGFIEMARKSARPLEFDFQSIDEKYSFFTIKISV